MAVKIIQDYRREMQNGPKNGVIYLSVLHFCVLRAFGQEMRGLNNGTSGHFSLINYLDLRRELRNNYF